MRMPFEVLGYVPDNRNLKCSDLSSVQMTQGLPEPHDPTFNCFYFWGSWLSPMPLTQNMKTGCRYAQLIRLHILSKTSVASLATDWWMEPRPPAYVIWKFLPAWQIAGFTHTQTHTQAQHHISGKNRSVAAVKSILRSCKATEAFMIVCISQGVIQVNHMHTSYTSDW